MARPPDIVIRLRSAAFEIIGREKIHLAEWEGKLQKVQARSFSSPLDLSYHVHVP